jgi:hypothetical protein
VNSARFDVSDLPSRNFRPRIYGVGAWTEHLYFGYDLVAQERPSQLVELGTDRGESYFAFCQSASENRTGTRCFAVDTWKGDAQSGFYDETIFKNVAAHNARYYKRFSTLLRCQFDDALKRFAGAKTDILHLDGLHSEEAVRHDLENWLPKLAPGGLLLLHDVNIHRPDFGAWKAWGELTERGRSFMFRDGPGLGLWEKPPKSESRFRDLFLEPANNSAAATLAVYYHERSCKLQERITHKRESGAIQRTGFAQETIIQIFHTADGTHREEDSVCVRIGHGDWKNVAIPLPSGAKALPLRIDFVSALTVIDIAHLRVTKSGQNLFDANNPADFDKIAVRGHAQRLAQTEFLRLKISGIDPQLYLPPLAATGDQPLRFEMRLRVRA